MNDTWTRVTGNLVFSISLAAIGLFAAMLVALELGRRIGTRRLAALPPGTSWEIGTLDGAVFGLLGLLIAFTFSGAVTRFEARRHLVVEETNAIGTAYLRLDLLPVAAQPALRDALRRYLDARLEVYRSLPDLVAAKQALARSVQIQGEIWRGAVAACRADPTSSTTMLVLGALNAMIDITTTRTMVAENHPPAVIFLMLFGLALASALLAGHGMAGRPRSWIHVIGFAAAIATAAFVTLDIEFPRLGLIRVDSFDRALIELRSGMQ